MESKLYLPVNVTMCNMETATNSILNIFILKIEKIKS
jgi:hypothetical protein